MGPGLRYCPFPEPSPWPARTTVSLCWPVCLLHHLCGRLRRPCSSGPCLPQVADGPRQWGTGEWGRGECGLGQKQLCCVAVGPTLGCLCELPMVPRPWWWPYKRTTQNIGAAYRKVQIPVPKNHASTYASPREGPKHRLYYLERISPERQG